LIDNDVNIHVQLGDYSKYEMKGEGTIMFHLELGGLLDAQYVVYVPGLKKNFLLDLAMEDKGIFVTSQKGKLLVL
jgi:hypothetical protein